jgi:GLPGLI family protein
VDLCIPDGILTLINIPFRTINQTAPSLSVHLHSYLKPMQISTTMKRMIILLGVLVSLTAAHIVFGQGEGAIVYESKMNLHRSIPKENEGIKNMIPEFRTVKDQLFFNANESLFVPIIEDEDEDTNSGGGGMVMRIQRPQNEIYISQTESKRVLLQEFMGKKYLIEDSIKIQPWKFGTETKTIAGYECRQASYYNEDRKQNIVAWYTDKLRPFLGPEGFNTLPGAVLHVDINDGERLITAKNIDLRPLKKNEMKVPSGGTKTTEPEFRKLMNEQMERMRQNGGGGRMIIRN